MLQEIASVLGGNAELGASFFAMMTIVFLTPVVATGDKTRI